MWRFKPFGAKEHVGLEGRTIDIGNLKVHIRNPIAEGGFSCVYLGRDPIHPSKQYAVKHIICNDEESLDLVMKEIRVMKSLKGHPNVVALQAHTILDMGRTKEALLVMEFCEKSLVNVLESRGAGYYEEKQVLSIFRDVCNAVFAMHCQSPPIAHRDLKAENILLGSDGMWKLCDFGSTSTNHKRFERPEEMGIEEDNIRKYTTPAYRSPEMWDLFRRELINEKVDIWALGCLLFRICYFKSAFDGESKLQILNGNYRIPDLPKYSSFITDLIKDMLEASPEARPDITQVWFRVNEQLPIESQKSLPDRPDDMRPLTADAHDEGILNDARKSSPMPRRSPPPPPAAKEHIWNVATPPSAVAKAGGGAFWSTEHAKNSPVMEDKGGPVFDEEVTSQSTLKHDRQSPDNRRHPENASTPKDPNPRSHSARNAQGNSLRRFDVGPSEDFEISFFPEDSNRGAGNQTFNTFVADFDTSKLDQGSTNMQSAKEDAIKTEEVDRLKEQLKQSNLEKAEITAKYEKLTAICRSQRQEIQELKQALAARTPSPNRDASKIHNSSGNKLSVTPTQREKKEGTIWELQEGMFADSSSPSPDSLSWPAFPNQPKPQPSNLKSVRTTNGHQNSPAASSKPDVWGFGTDNFTAAPASAVISKPPGSGNTSQRFAEPKSVENKPVSSAPAGWAGF